MARQLKTYITSIGFFDLAVAAPSMKAALEAWGAGSNLFHSGFAEETDNPKIVAATMGKPGVVLRRAVGSKVAFSENAALPQRTTPWRPEVVLVRQMPGTAGVVFITLRDETGVANIVVWPRVFDRFRKEVMGGRLLLVEGRIQRSPEGVVHLVSDRIADRSFELDRLSEDRFCAQVHSDQIPPPPDSRGMRRHPQEVRAIPKSRDFH